MDRREFIDWYEDVRVGTRRLISMVPDEAFDFRPHRDAPTFEMLIRAFASLEEQYVRGVCTGDWSDPRHATDVRQQIRRAIAEEADDYGDGPGGPDGLDTARDVIDHLDQVHQEALDIIAELSEEEFLKRRVLLPWGEQGTILRLLVGLVEREVHHRTELYLALQHYGIPMSHMMIWGP